MTAPTAPPKRAIVKDREIIALSRICKLLDELDPEARGRTLRYIEAKYAEPTKEAT